MATQYVIASAVAGRTLTAKLYNVSSSALVATASAVAEDVASTGVYRCTFSEVAALSGTYRLVLTDDVASNIGVAIWKTILTGTDTEIVSAAEFTSGGGDASEAKQDQIIAAITPITTVYSPQPSSETLTLIRGDAYDGVSNSKLSWKATKDVDGETVNFTIRDSKDVIILDQDTAGVTTLATGSLVEVSLSTAATELLDPAVSIFTFDVEIEFSAGSRWTITKGNVCVESDVSR
jgi:hypothetical protein